MAQSRTPNYRRPAATRLASVVALALLLTGTGFVVWNLDNDTSQPVTAQTSDDTTTPAAPALTSAQAFQRTWQRSDGPVADMTVARTWIWGPASREADQTEAYAESPGGQRAVRYYDKSRMEISDPAGDQQSGWYITNGLLVVELISGRMQTGENRFEQRSPAIENVAGDDGPGNGPTYATLAALLAAPPLPDGSPIVQRIDNSGVVTIDPSLAAYGATAAFRVTVPGIDHQVASPFWTFMRSSGPIEIDGVTLDGPLFENPFYATGYPLTEPYWTTVKVGGTPHEVLLQCFERRCLTYTPGNDAGWQVESGNVGRHYHDWRYGTDASPTPAPTTIPTPTSTATATSPAPTSTATATSPSSGVAPVVIGPGAVDAWMRSVVRDAEDRVWLVAMNNNAANAGSGPGELRVYRATAPGIPTAFEHVGSALIRATGSSAIPFADAAIDGQNRLHVIWVDYGATGQPLNYRVLDLTSGSWIGPAIMVDDTDLSGFGGFAGQGGVSIAVGFDGQPRVAYTVAGFQNQIRTRALGPSGWGEASDPLQVSGAWVWHPTLALAGDGTWYLAGYDSTSQTILATHDSGSGWTAAEIVASDVLGPESVDQSPALLVTPAGVPTLTYLDGDSHIRVSQYISTGWTDVPVGGDHHTHAPGLGVYADGTLIIAGHNEGSPPTALNAIQGSDDSWGAWDAVAQIRADGSEVFRWAGAHSTLSADTIDLVFFDEDANDDDVFDDQTLYYLAIPPQ
ncbi:MAG TPA: hypothetical protein VFV93_02245 [Thermomicrobiales bacterium]|nr:hypothetical protein [Thermomicrobiales bacterium]